MEVVGMAVESSKQLHLQVTVPDPEHDERPIQVHAGSDRVIVTEDGDIILNLSANESEGLRHQLRGVERTARHLGGDA